MNTYSARISKVINQIITGILAVVILIFVVIVTILSVKSSNQKIENQAIEVSDAISKEIAQKQVYLQSMATAAERLGVTGYEGKVPLRAGDSSEDTWSETMKLVDSYVAGDENISAAYTCYDTNSTVMSGGWEPPADFVVMEREWYIQAKANPDNTYVSTPYVDEQTGNFCITISKAFQVDGTVVGVVGFDLYMDNIIDLVAAQNTSDSGYVFLVAADGTILTHKSADLALTTEHSENLSTANRGRYQKLANQDGRIYQITDYNGRAMRMIASTIDECGWKVIAAESTLKSLQMTIILFVICIAILIVSILLSSRICKNKIGAWFQPIESVSDKVGDIAEGNLDVRFDEEPITDEIEKLSGSLNQTIDSLKYYINDISQVVTGISNKDLTVRIEADYKGSFLEIKESLQVILDSLNQAFADIEKQAEVVVEFSKQVEQSSFSVAEGATEQNEAIMDVVSNMSVLSDEIHHIKGNAANVSQVSDATNEKLQHGNEEMQKLLTAMDEINESSGKISEIITTINAIADQTGLLALNASIEAARAGENGKGFAVVATEISKLAAESLKASDSIRMLIDDSGEAVKRGREIAEATAETLSSGVEESAHSLEDIRMIAEHVDNQSAAVDMITGRIEEISRIIEANAATSQENAAISTELINCANALKQEVEAFKLNETE